jgi:ABC-type dipeptide transport system, periplasmic component
MLRLSSRAISLTIAVLCTVVSPHVSAAEEVKPGGSLVIGMTQTPSTLNPAVQTGQVTSLPGTQLFASPLRYDAEWKPQPYLAEKWELAKDGKSLTLHLVKNAVFHDGTPITSQDVAFSIMALKEYHPFKTMYGPVEKVETPDAHTAVIRMSAPHPSILLAMSPALCPIMPKHIYGSGNLLTHPRNTSDVVGSGPFQLVEFKAGQYVRLKRFDRFFIKGRPYLERLVIKVAPDSSTAVLELEQGQIDVLPYFLNARDTRRLADNPRLAVTAKGYEGIGALDWVEFNLARKPFDDVRVRQAVAHAVDRRFIHKALMLGTMKPATGPIAPGSPFYTADVQDYSLDLKKAAALLEAAGYKPDRDGTRLKVTMDYIPGAEEASKNVAEYFKAQLRKIGMEVTLRASPDITTWINRIASHDYDMTTDLVFNWGDPTIGVARMYLTSNIKKRAWTNVMSYSNPRVDELLASAGQELDPAARKQQYVEFQKIIAKDLPILYVGTVPYQTIHDRRIVNVPTNIWGFMSPLDTVYWNKKQ